MNTIVRPLILRGKSKRKKTSKQTTNQPKPTNQTNEHGIIEENKIFEVAGINQWSDMTPHIYKLIKCSTLSLNRNLNNVIFQWLFFFFFHYCHSNHRCFHSQWKSSTPVSQINTAEINSHTDWQQLKSCPNSLGLFMGAETTVMSPQRQYSHLNINGFGCMSELNIEVSIFQFWLQAVWRNNHSVLECCLSDWFTWTKLYVYISCWVYYQL